MSGTAGCMQKLFRDIIRDSGTTSHNLNFMINDSAEATVGTVSEIFNYFGRSLKRCTELAFAEENVKKLKSKKLCTTR